jgi:hypothetical protein
MAAEPKRKLDYSDYVATPDDGNRYEIVDGNLYVTPSSRPMHQRVSRKLQRTLEDYFHGRSIGEVFDAPIDLILTNHDVMVPDLIVVRRPDATPSSVSSTTGSWTRRTSESSAIAWRTASSDWSSRLTATPRWCTPTGLGSSSTCLRCGAKNPLLQTLAPESLDLGIADAGLALGTPDPFR